MKTNKKEELMIKISIFGWTAQQHFDFQSLLNI